MRDALYAPKMGFDREQRHRTPAELLVTRAPNHYTKGYAHDIIPFDAAVLARDTDSRIPR